MDTLQNLTVNVDLQNPNGFDDLPDLYKLQAWCRKSIQESAYAKAFEGSLSVLIRIVDDKESANLNKTYREKDGPTNVLSFPNDISDIMFDITELNSEQSKQLKAQNSHLGDLVICESLVTKEAIEQGKSKISHWAHLIIHGTLHLQGFDHIDDTEAEHMESLEILILEQLGYNNPYVKSNQ